jgi:hypothetical protein
LAGVDIGIQDFFLFCNWTGDEFPTGVNDATIPLVNPFPVSGIKALECITVWDLVHAPQVRKLPLNLSANVYDMIQLNLGFFRGRYLTFVGPNSHQINGLSGNYPGKGKIPCFSRIPKDPINVHEESKND